MHLAWPRKRKVARVSGNEASSAAPTHDFQLLAMLHCSAAGNKHLRENWSDVLVYSLICFRSSVTEL
ncbi:hypothetical protein GJAV_G00204820 [Gymnothorax javanicus]|nr:hypothetical protein GJAV_G00204820 [Gymnothorax javanicus]